MYSPNTKESVSKKRSDQEKSDRFRASCVLQFNVVRYPLERIEHNRHSEKNLTEKALRKLNNKNSRGTDGIVVEILKADGEYLKEIKVHSVGGSAPVRENRRASELCALQFIHGNG